MAATPGPGARSGTTPEEVFVQSWTKRDGLPSNSIKEIETTPDGYLWIGSENGLTRFDGVRFTQFEPSRFPLLKGAAIEQLLSSGGDFYIDTFGELLRFDGEEIRRVTVRGRPGVGIASIARDGQGRVGGCSRAVSVLSRRTNSSPTRVAPRIGRVARCGCSR